MIDADELRGQLLSVGGVTEAEVTTSADGGLAGIRIRLEEGADGEDVGRRVQEILAGHRVRGRMEGSGQQSGPPPPPGAPTETPTIVALADFEQASRPVPAPVTDAALDSVTVEESPEGLVVTASAVDGRTVVRPARSHDTGTVEAVVAAAAELAGGPQPTLSGWHDAEVGGVRVVTVVLELSAGRRAAGAAVVSGGLPFAVAAAVWQALDSA